MLHDTVRRSEQSASARSTPTPLPSSPTAGLASPTSAPFSTSHEIQSLSDAVYSRLSLLVDFLASPTVSPASESPTKMSETCGLSASACFGSFAPDLHSSRTSVDSSPARTYPAMVALHQDFFSTAFCLTWPRFGTLANGRLYQLPPLALPTDETESGSSASMNFPTPRANDAEKRGLIADDKRNGLPGMIENQRNWPTARAEDGESAGRRHSRDVSDTLTAAVRDWPTMTVRDTKGPSARCYNGHPENLADLIEWPTPTASEGSKIPSQANYGQIELSNHPAIVGEPTREKGQKSRSGPPPIPSGPPVPVSGSTDGSRQESWATPNASNGTGEWDGQGGAPSLQTQAAGKLNPSWVETLMAFPIGWTQLPAKFVKPKAAK